MEFFRNFDRFYGISLDLINSVFEYGGKNRMFDAICNSTLWPMSNFDYKTGDLRILLPTAYYQFKLATGVGILCENNFYSYEGIVNENMISNQLSFTLNYGCQAFADSLVLILRFNISLELLISVTIPEFNDYINFVRK